MPETATLTTNATWASWADNAGTSGTLDYRTTTATWQPTLPSPEEIERQNREAEERACKKKEAQERALRLLREMLTREQLAAFEKDKRIPVDAPSGQRYIIHKGRAGNVFSIKDGKQVEKFCIQPDDLDIPDEDCMLAQKLLLEANEDEFLRVANRTRLVA